MEIIVINGPNLNLLGTREPAIYGFSKLSEVIEELKVYGEELGIAIEHFQSNHEGAIIDKLHDSVGKYDGIILNAGAYSHYSYAIRDAISAIELPVIEVHITNIYKRESFRKISVIAPVCTGQITGLGIKGYQLALNYLFYYCK